MRYVSPSSVHVLGWTPQEMIGTGPEVFVLAEDLPILAAGAARNDQPGAQSQPVTLRMRKKDGSTPWMEISATVIRDSATGEHTETILIMRDVTERKMLEEKLQKFALTDGLTGLSNRRAFDETLEREWLRTVREGSQMSLLLLDLDHFKEFNDQYGHQVGDDCLRAAAHAVRDAVRATDVPSRYGGEEISVILPSAGSAGAVEAAEKIRRAIEGLRLPHDGNKEGGGWLTASIGVATALARDGGTMRMPESLLLAADTALYKAKHQGRNRIATALLMAAKEN